MLDSLHMYRIVCALAIPVIVAVAGICAQIKLSVQNGRSKTTAHGKRSILAQSDVVYPLGSSIVNVKLHGAKGDGVKDDTDAIIAALRESANTPDHILYFPNGTYLVSRTIEWKDAAGGWVG